MKTDNRSVGNRFEQEFAELLSKNGFWAHVMQQNKSGQPADIIAVRGHFHTLIDCKEIADEKDGFPFSRVEENQDLAMKLFTKRCCDLCYFALKLPDGQIRMIPHSRIGKLAGSGYKSITMRMMETETVAIEKWLEYSRAWAED